MSERTKLRAVDGGAITPDEAAMLAAYRALKNVHRGHVLRMAQILAENAPSARPTLRLIQAGAEAHLKPAETRMDAVLHGGGERSRARRGARLIDADYAAIVKRYEDAGDVQNADIIRRQWQVATDDAH